MWTIECNSTVTPVVGFTNVVMAVSNAVALESVTQRTYAPAVRFADGIDDDGRPVSSSMYSRRRLLEHLPIVRRLDDGGENDQQLESLVKKKTQKWERR